MTQYSCGLDEVRISALIASHGRDAVGKAISSALNQTMADELYEVIVVADTHIPALKEYEDHPKVHLKYTDKKDPGGKWADAIDMAQGEILCFLDDDDEWTPDKLASVDRTFSSAKSLGYYHNSHVSIDYDNTILENFPELRHYYTIAKIGNFSTMDKPESRTNFQLMSALGAPFNSSCISLRREILAPYVDFLRKGKWMVDYFWFYAFAISKFDILIDDKALTLYRRRNDAKGDLLNNIRNSRNQKITIYQRYLDSHRAYVQMVLGYPIEKYIKWLISKIELMLDMYSNEANDISKLISMRDMLKYLPMSSKTGFLSSVLLGITASISFLSKKASMGLAIGLERLGLSLL